MSKRAEYALAFYDLLRHNATNPGAGEIPVFSGKLGDLFKELKISNQYYTKNRDVLLALGAITITKKGYRGQPSIVEIGKRPNTEDIEKYFRNRLTGPSEAATLRAEFEALVKRVQRLEAKAETTGGLNIAEALRNLEKRLSLLESRE